MRILWASDAAWSQSGYGVITRQQVPKIRDLGHDVALLATFGLHGAVREWEGIRVYPGGADSFANDVIGHYARDWKADIVITLKDSFVFRPEAMQGLRWCGMVPIDHEPTPPPVVQVVRSMYRPIAYAPNGFRELRKAGFDPLYCPHSYDPRVFHPESKEEARKFLGLPQDIFIVGTVAVNRGGIPSRKAWPQNLEAFALFAKDKPNARYFIHTDLAGDGYEGGLNIQALAAQLGCADKILFCDQDRYRQGGFPEEYLLAFYNSIDVLNAVSLGEGFGIPALEAQACGCPVIVSDFAAHRDLCFAGWKVGDGIKFYDGQGAWTFIPKPEAVAEAMEEAYEAIQCPNAIISLPQVTSEEELATAKEELRRHFDGQHRTAVLPDNTTVQVINTLREQAITGASAYQLDHVIQTHWKPALEELEASIASDHYGRGVLRIIRPEEVLA